MKKAKKDIKKVVLAYSGGLDTSIIIPWLKENYGCEVVAVSANVGQADELEGLESKALATGASKLYVLDLVDEFVEDYIAPTVMAGAKYEGYGKAFFRSFDLSQPLGDIHQIHGSGIGQREVMMTLSDKDEASRLICGVTWGGEGSWTSWPPHQHEKDLEEVYCYMDMPLPHFGFHISYLKSGEVEDIVTHTVHSGTFVQAPCGYHPTVASPGTRNAYFWALAAMRHSSRSYNLAVLDPALENFNSER